MDDCEDSEYRLSSPANSWISFARNSRQTLKCSDIGDTKKIQTISENTAAPPPAMRPTLSALPYGDSKTTARISTHIVHNEETIAPPLRSG